MLGRRGVPVAMPLVEAAAVAARGSLGLAITCVVRQAERLLEERLHTWAVRLGEDIGQVAGSVGGLAVVADLQLNRERPLEAALRIGILADIAPDLPEHVQAVGLAPALAERLVDA